MPSGMFWGEFAKGLAGGLRNAEEMRLKSEEHKLRSKMLEHQLKKMDYDESQRQQQAIQREEQAKELGKLTEMLTQGMPGQAPAPLQPGQEGPEPAPGFEVPRTPANREQILGQGLRAIPQEHRYNLLQEYMKAPKGGPVDMTEYQRQSLDLRRQQLATPREGVGVESQTWSRIVKENPGADVATLREIYNREVNKTAGTRAGGAESGRMDVRSTPRFQETERGVSQARAEGSTAGRPLGEAAQTQVAQLESLLSNTLPTIRKNYDPNYLGPIKGTDMAFEGRRRVGSSLGSPVSDRETQFRLALADAGDILLRARSGAQINEQEYGRLKGILPKATDEPTVFNSALARFEAELRSILKQKVQVGRTPRGQLGGGGPAPAPSGKLRFNPQTGRIE